MTPNVSTPYALTMYRYDIVLSKSDFLKLSF